jgi:sugar phosphate isomerase/epimerase
MPKQHYGMPTLIELPSLEETAALCRELGLQFIELNMNLPQYQADKMDTRELTRIAEQYNIYYTIHLDEAFNPCDFNKRVAKAYVDTALQVIDIAKILGIPVINMHYQEGIYFTLPECKVFLFEQYKTVYFETLRNFRNACEQAIGDADIKICVENSFGWGKAPFITEGLDMLLESSVFALTLDTGHNADTGGGDESFILAQGNKFTHLHLHDGFVGKHRNHLPLGAGELDIPRYLDLAREHECRVLLETKTIAGLKQSVEWLKERGYL